eukprot:344026-Amphidinium_carterae.2
MLRCKYITTRQPSVTRRGRALSPNNICTTEDDKVLLLSTIQLGTTKHQFNHTVHYSTIYYVHHAAWLLNRYLRHSDGKISYERNWKRPYNQQIITFGEKVYVEKLMPANKKLYRRNLTKNRSTKLPSEQQTDKTLLLKVTSLTGEYDNSKKKTDKDKIPIPARLYELKLAALPMAKPRTGTTQQEWHFKPPDQPTLDLPQRAPKFPTFPETTGTTVQPPPGLQQQTPEPKIVPPEPIRP